MHFFKITIKMHQIKSGPHENFKENIHYFSPTLNVYLGQFHNVWILIWRVLLKRTRSASWLVSPFCYENKQLLYTYTAWYNPRDILPKNWVVENEIRVPLPLPLQYFKSEFLFSFPSHYTGTETCSNLSYHSNGRTLWVLLHTFYHSRKRVCTYKKHTWMNRLPESIVT